MPATDFVINPPGLEVWHDIPTKCGRCGVVVQAHRGQPPVQAKRIALYLHVVVSFSSIERTVAEEEVGHGAEDPISSANSEELCASGLYQRSVIRRTQLPEFFCFSKLLIHKK